MAGPAGEDLQAQAVPVEINGEDVAASIARATQEIDGASAAPIAQNAPAAPPPVESGDALPEGVAPPEHLPGVVPSQADPTLPGMTPEAPPATQGPAPSAPQELAPPTPAEPQAAPPQVDPVLAQTQQEALAYQNLTPFLQSPAAQAAYQQFREQAGAPAEAETETEDPGPELGYQPPEEWDDRFVQYLEDGELREDTPSEIAAQFRNFQQYNQQTWERWTRDPIAMAQELIMPIVDWASDKKIAAYQQEATGQAQDQVFLNSHESLLTEPDGQGGKRLSRPGEAVRDMLASGWNVRQSIDHVKKYGLAPVAPQATVPVAAPAQAPVSQSMPAPAAQAQALGWPTGQPAGQPSAAGVDRRMPAPVSPQGAEPDYSGLERVSEVVAAVQRDAAASQAGGRY